jgi:pimeloyl-ACP methyl ester carboxylesterase
MPTIQVNDVNLYYELHGPAGAPVLVLNNGILMNAAASWVFQTPALSRHYRLLQYDCRGQGQSDHPEGPYSMELHAADLAGLLDALSIDRAHIAGASYGGEVAQAFALAYPARVLSLLLLDTASELGPELRATAESWRDAAHRADAEAFFNASVPWNFSPQFIRDHPALLADARRRYALLDFPAVTRLCDCFLGVDFTARLGEIAAPTCIITGELDLLKGPAYAHVLQSGIPHAELHILPGAGHATPWERPEEFNTVILGFLAKQP